MTSVNHHNAKFFSAAHALLEQDRSLIKEEQILRAGKRKELLHKWVDECYSIELGLIMISPKLDANEGTEQ